VKILCQPITPNRLDGTIDLMSMIIFSTTGSISQIDPIGRPVAGSGIPLGIDKGFHGKKWMPIIRFPVTSDDFHHLSQYMGCQMTDMNPGKD
jgi:hypothetical protein